ncbi:RecX family transcriptional regulator [Paenibacillus sp. HB172176]|uniref:RecX family transcriptional regulator n=1 Tax=Paenibacillus sp. HB172176 TaxID=2493690 RepID=UPI00143CA8F0|nr:RecX family transcriptional regulator [Paenibacillus sp. HB172176]
MTKEDEGKQEKQEWTITSVKRDKKEKRRYLLYGDYSDEPYLSLHEDLLIRHRLMKDQIVSAEQAREIREEDERYRAYLLGIAYLGLKQRTRKQIKQYLIRKELEEIYIEAALDRLESEQLVDDEGYARQFAESRMSSGQKGRLMIRHELQQRGISKAAAAEALSELNREQELAAARVLASKKSRSLKGDARTRRSKLMGFLLRRGFPGDIVRDAIRTADLGTESIDDEEDDGVLLDN